MVIESKLESSFIGFIGTGAMGIEMVLRIIAAGNSVVVSNRTRRNAERAERAGAMWADMPRDVAEASSSVLSCLLDSDAVERVYLGDGGLIETARPGQVFVEHGTFSPMLAGEIHRRFDTVGAHFVDMPVTGGPDGTRKGRLAAMAGGTKESITTISAIAGAYCSQITQVGGPGAGLQLKLVNQLLVSVHMASAAEAISLLHSLDIDLDTASSVLERGWAGSAMLTRAFAQLRASDVQGTGVKISGMLAIQELIAQLTGTHRHPVFEGSREVFQTATALGYGDADPALMHRAVGYLSSIDRT